MPTYNKIINEGEKGYTIQDTFTKNGTTFDLSSYTCKFKLFDNFGNNILNVSATATSSSSGILAYTLDSSSFTNGKGLYKYAFDIEGFGEHYLEPLYTSLYYKAGNYYTSPDLISTELNSTTRFTDDTLPDLVTVYNWIDEAMAEINIYTNYIFGSTTSTSVYMDYDGCGILRLPHNNILTLTLKYNENSQGYAPSWIDLEEGWDKNYLLYQTEGEVEFISGINSTELVMPIEGKKKFCVVYKYGYQTVPLEIQRLCTLMVSKRVISSLVNKQANSEGGTIRVGTIMISDPTSYSVNYIKDINNEINTLFGRIGQEFKTYRITRCY